MCVEDGLFRDDLCRFMFYGRFNGSAALLSEATKPERSLRTRGVGGIGSHSVRPTRAQVRAAANYPSRARLRVLA
jgi:hypothetical protein